MEELGKQIIAEALTLLKTRAREMAVFYHGDQKYGNDPYVVHLDEVAAICAPFGDISQIIAYLHDSLEDTALTPSGIEREFGRSIAESVMELTDSPGLTRKERKHLTYARLAQTSNSIVCVVKTADRLANVRRCVKDNPRLLQVYKEEHPTFRAAVHRLGVNDDLIAEIDRLLS